ncbi:MAG: metallophosphoesterase [Oscillospiraceae bacterium]|nr:metallophosphoesterase [Oscillospiraceae bacterium]
MALYVIGDLHLSLSGEKPMDVFGERWANHTERLREAFSHLTDDDVTVLAGDTSWGMSLEGALPDFQFIDALPGKKLLLKGNHDYWWGTAAKMKKFFAAHDLTTLDILHNNCFFYGDYALCGTRGWFYEEDAEGTHTGKMLAREALRLEASFQCARETAPEKAILCFLHYPPIYQGYQCPELLDLIDRYYPERCYYGHLHGATHRRAFEGRRNATDYALISADYLGFNPKKICE